MPTDNDPNTGQAAIPDNTVASGASPALTDTGSTPGLAPGDETHRALKEQLSMPDVQRFKAQPNTQGGPEEVSGYVIPPDGQARFMAPASWHGPWAGNASETDGEEEA